MLGRLPRSAFACLPLAAAALLLGCGAEPLDSSRDATEQGDMPLGGFISKPPRDTGLRRDLAAGTTVTMAAPSPDGPAPSAYTGADLEGTLFSFGDLEPVDDPGAYPARVNVALGLTYPDTTGTCSGTLIDARHVLTAGHCVYYGPAGGWVEEINVVAGDGSYGFAKAIGAMSFSGFVDYDDYDYDVALVYLDRPVGALTGWHGYGVHSCWSLTHGDYESYSYPGLPPYNGDMYFWDGTFDWCPLAHTVQTNHDGGDSGVDGMSGGGIYNVQDEGPYVRGVWSRLYDLDPEGTRALRLWNNAADTIQSEIASHRADDADLMPVGLEFPFEITPEVDDTPSGVKIRVHNYSTEDWSGSVTVKFYLSTNTTISSSDTLLGSVTDDLDIDALHTATIDVPGNALHVPLGALPAYGPTAFYNVGAIITAADASSANNKTIGTDIQTVLVHDAESQLDVVDVEAADGSYFSSENVPVDFQVANIGDLASGAWTGSFYLSKFQTVGTGSIFVGKGNAPALAPGELYADSVSLDLTGVASGSYFVHLLVQDDGGGELASGFDVVKINVKHVLDDVAGQPSNLRIDYVGFSGQTFDAGDDLAVAYSVTNSGSQNSGPWAAWVYASPVASVSPDMVYLGGGATAGLAPGAVKAAVTNLSLQHLSPGDWYVVMVVAAQNESTMNDNVKVSVQSFEIEMGLSNGGGGFDP